MTTSNYWWTTAQTSILCEKYSTAPSLQALADEVGRTIDALKTKASDLKLSRVSRYTPAEDERVLKEYPTCASVDALAADMGRTRKSLELKAARLGAKRRIRTRRNPAALNAPKTTKPQRYIPAALESVDPAVALRSRSPLEMAWGGKSA